MKIVLILLFIVSCQNLNFILPDNHSSFLENKIELQYASENKAEDKKADPQSFTFNLVKCTMITQDEIFTDENNLKLDNDGISVLSKITDDNMTKYSE